MIQTAYAKRQEERESSKGNKQQTKKQNKKMKSYKSQHFVRTDVRINISER